MAQCQALSEWWSGREGDMKQVPTLKLLLARRTPPQMAESGTGQLELYASVCATEKGKDVQVCRRCGGDTCAGTWRHLPAV